MKQKVNPKFALACLRDYLDPSPNGRKNSAYKVALETHLTPSTISNYMNGRSQPSGRSLEILNYYFRLEEYQDYLDKNMTDEETGTLRDYMPFVEWIEDKKVRPLDEVVDPRTGVVKTVIPKEGASVSPEKMASMKFQGELLDSAIAGMSEFKDETDVIESMNRELEALHALVVAQKERLESQDKIIAALRSALYKN